MNRFLYVLTLRASCLGLLFVTTAINPLFSQTTRTEKKVPRAVELSRSSGQPFTRVNLFQKKITAVEDDAAVKQVVAKSTLLKMDAAALQALLLANPTTLTLPIPSLENPAQEVELYQADLVTPDFILRYGSAPEPMENTSRGLHYRGIIKGNPNSIVAISILEHEVMGFMADENGNQAIGRLRSDNAEYNHILYKDKDWLPEVDFTCGTSDAAAVLLKKLPQPAAGKFDPDDCVRVYLEIKQDIFDDKQEETLDYILGIFNQTVALYENDDVKMSVSEIKIWDTNMPYDYNGSDIHAFLQDFQDNSGSFNGHIAGLLSYQVSGGGKAAGFDGLCNSLFADDSKFVAGFSMNYLPAPFTGIPAYSRTVKVITHEIGHLLGSVHTHACAWGPDEDEALDNCWETEGPCDGGPAPTNGGTIMSYCDKVSGIGVNFNNGFGTEPGDRIRAYVADAGCLSSECAAPNLTYVPNAGMLQVNGIVVTITNVTVTNTGEGFSNPSSFGFYLSSDGDFSADEDYLIGAVDIPFLNMDEEEPFNFLVDVASIDPPIPAGNYFVGIIVDHLNIISETDEQDNTGGWDSPILTIPEEGISCEDAVLIVCGQSHQGTTANGNFGVSSYSCGSWNESGPEIVHTISTIQTGDLQVSLSGMTVDLDVFILGGDCNAATCLAYGGNTATYTDAPAGIYYVVVDGYEGSAGNYTLTTSCEAGKPNLTRLSDNLTINGTNINMVAQIVNNSCSGAAGSSVVRFYVSTDANFVESDDYLVASVSVPSLGIYQSYTATLNTNILTANPSIVPGSYYIGYAIDWFNSVAESNESDNIFHLPGTDNQIVVPGNFSPNLTLHASGASCVVNGSQIDHTVTIVNTETVPSGAFKVGYYLSTFQGDYEYLIGTSNITGLAAGSTAQVNFSIDAATASAVSPGFYYLEFHIDYQGAVGETNEGDNGWYWPGVLQRVLISESPYCGMSTYLTAPTGSLSDGSGANSYYSETYCQWLIEPGVPTKSITLSFSQFDTEPGYDYVRVYDGSTESSPLLASYSGSNLPASVISGGGSMLVRFTTDGSLVESGFTASYTSVPFSYCNGLTTLTASAGTITDGSGCEDYTKNANCTWLVKPSAPTQSINLTFDEFDLENGNDYLSIYKGENANAPLYAVYTGAALPPAVILSEDALFVQFTSNASIEQNGFILHYTSSSEPATATISGLIAREDGAPVNLITVLCTGTNPYFTSANGTYEFSDLPLGDDYVIDPTRNINPKEGVNVLDVLAIQWHLLNTQLLNSPYKMIAADVNKSGSLTGQDLTTLTQLIVGNISQFPNNESWRFIPQNYTFPNPSNPFVPAFPETIPLNDLDYDITNQDFVAVKVGDVNLSAVMAAGSETEERSANRLWMVVKDFTYQGEAEIAILFRAKDFAKMTGFQMDLSFDPAFLEFGSFIPGTLPDFQESNLGNTFLHQGILPMLWVDPYGNRAGADMPDGAVLFGLKFKVLKPFGKLEDLLSIPSGRMISFASTKDIELLQLGLLFSETPVVSQETRLVAYPNRPDPFSSSTILPFTLTEPCTVQLRLFDYAGKELIHWSKECPAGYQEWTIDGQMLRTTGLYFYTLATPTDIITDKMVFERL